MDFGEALERVVAFGRLLVFFREGEVGDGADDDGAGEIAPVLRFEEAFDVAVIGVGDRGIGADLGDEVVVVRVEPFRHLLRRASLVAASEGEVEFESAPALEARGHGSEQACHVEDLVVEGGVLRKGGVLGAQAEFDEAREVCLSQLGFGFEELFGARPPGPMGFECFLQFSVPPNAGVAEDRCCGEGRHAWLSCGECGGLGATPRRRCVQSISG